MGNVAICHRRTHDDARTERPDGGDTTARRRRLPFGGGGHRRATRTPKSGIRDGRVPPLRELKPFVPPIAHGTVVKVYDGDTITVAAPLPNEEGVPTYFKFSVRLRGIDCPELRTRNDVEKSVAIVARDALQARILHKEVQLTARATDKYGRLLANVYYHGDDGEEPELGQWLLAKRLAVPYDGGTKTVVTNWHDYHHETATAMA